MYVLPSDAVASAIYFTRYIDSTKDIVVSFDFACYGPNTTGSEGFCLFFTDSVFDTVRYGGPGPGLCYSSVSGVKIGTQVEAPGVQGGVVGIGFYITGNFGSSDYFPTGLDVAPNTISVRGAQLSDNSNLSGYPFIIRSNNINTYNFESPIGLYEQITDNRQPVFKRVRVRVADFGKRLIVDIKKITDTYFTNYLTCDLSNFISWPVTVRTGLAFSTGLQTDTIFKVRNFNINGAFSNVVGLNTNTYTYNLDTKTLSGSDITYLYPSNVLQSGDIIRVQNTNTTTPAYSGTNNPLINVSPINGPQGVPYQSGDDLVRITPV